MTYFSVLQAIFGASTIDAKLQIIQANPTLLNPQVLESLEAETKNLWQSGALSSAEDVWRVQRMLERVQRTGVEATRAALANTEDHLDNEDLLLEKSATPLQTPYAIQQLLLALGSNDTDVDKVKRTLDTFAVPLRPPTAPAILRWMGRQAQQHAEASPLRFEHTAQLLEAYAEGADVIPLIAEWWPRREDILKGANPTERAALEYASAETWEMAYHYLRTQQSILYSEDVNTYLNNLLRGMHISGETGNAKLIWRRLRVLLRARIEGIDLAFAKFVWNSQAEQIWASPYETGLMEAASVYPGKMGPLVFLALALSDGDQDRISTVITQNRDFFRQPWVSYYARYMAEVDRAEHKGTVDLWENLAVQFERL